MNFAAFIEWITYKVKCKGKKYTSHTNYIFKVPPYQSKFTLKFRV